VFAVLAAFAAARLFAQQTITFGADDTRATAIDTTAPNSPTTLDLSSGSATQSGEVTGSGAIVKTGNGTIALTGSVNYTGATTITAGTLQIGNDTNASLASSGVTNDGTLVFDGSGVYFGVITGSGAVVFQGTTSNFILTSDQTYTGGTTIAAGSRLQLGSDSAAGSLLGNIVNNGALIIDRSNDYTLAGNISGSGSLTLIGYDANVLTLSGDNSYTDGTTISASPGKHPVVHLGSANALGTQGSVKLSGGTLQFSSENTQDYSSRFTDDDNQQFRFDTNGQSVTFATGLASAGGTLTKLGDGTLTLSGSSTYTGATTITAGTLRIGDGTTVSLASSNIVDDSALVFDGAGSYSGVISGAGTLAKSGNGTMTLTANQTYTGATSVSGGTLVLAGTVSYTGATTITAGTLQIGNGTSASLASSGVTNDGALVFDGGNSTYAGIISGSGSLTKTGAGTLTLTGENTYIGDTTITSGTLALGGASGTTGSVGGDIVNNASLLFERSNVATYANNISGSGSLTLIGYTGTSMTLSGNNTFAGGVSLAAAPGNSPVLVLASANPLGSAGTITLGGFTLKYAADNVTDYSARFSIAANQKYLIDTNGHDVTFASGLTSSGGNLTKSGAGILTLSGTNTFTGATSVEAGTLLINGSLANTAVTVAGGATLGGSGTIGGLTTIADGGILLASRTSGNSPGTLTFAAGLTLDAGAILDFQLGATSDEILLTGGTLTGPSGTGQVTLNLSDAGGFTARTYTLIDFSADGVTPSDFEAADFRIGTALAGFTYQLNLSGNSLQLTASAIPEPATYAALAALAALAVALAHRRRNQ
jgi:fibronectin-binding autotransporter adhesin